MNSYNKEVINDLLSYDDKNNKNINNKKKHNIMFIN